MQKPRELSQPNQLDMVGERGFEPLCPQTTTVPQCLQVYELTEPFSSGTRLAPVHSIVSADGRPSLLSMMMAYYQDLPSFCEPELVQDVAHVKVGGAFEQE